MWLFYGHGYCSVKGVPQGSVLEPLLWNIMYDGVLRLQLTLTAHKTEAVLISGRKIVEAMKVAVGGTRIESKRALKYLGVIINDRLKFKQHVKFIGAKA